MTLTKVTFIQVTRTKFLTLSMLTAAILNAQLPNVVLLQTRTSGSFLGLRFTDIDSDRARVLKLKETTGIEIQAVLSGAAADVAGIRPGDVILSYNGEKVLGAQQFIRLVSETPTGRQVRLTALRGGEQRQFVVTTGTRVEEDNAELMPSLQVTAIQPMDIPSTIMVWRNMLLGFESELLSDQMAQALGVKQGILIWNVRGGSPAQQAGLRAGDVVTGVCGHTIHSPREVGFALQQEENSQKPISLTVVRDHKPISVSIALTAK